ncbi:MAG: valine--tRNA ligase [Candidatus Magasanikbacteria bacterium RIFOXYC2_FULL_42_28]|uniref:Valine--tRNA ligase n=1 Tax=Candidatus Magasanikbacteria bacterium RIFOXYC2_FULL_42_28 TaxID=1798704 RepID=A0A1F6NXY7_9BACT|nr:MAG: valine--tRNA ligase [Candidatus Magasanikbacteria bacterium RIFOXYC2_FULL_42_28]
MNKELPKAYEPQNYEDAIYKRWEESGFFNPDVCVEKGGTDANAKPFTIVLPPPNVTGTLHIGHAMMLAIEDLMIRYHRMKGDKTLWLPGTDHAAIATQTKVEKLLIEKGIKDPKKELGREKFLDEVNKFAQASHDTIVNQCKKMGSSLDWSREAFTLDEPRNLAVRTVFKKMYDDGLIYRGYRIVNWCPRCHSTLADDEVEYKEQKTKFYYFKYGPVIIGTARPETKFLDKVIVVHPDDERYKKLQGTKFEMDWIGGKIIAKVIADQASDPKFGTGAMTITPAHSFEDYELAKKYNLDVVQIIDEDGNFTDAAGDFVGKNAQASREEIVKILADKGLLERVDENYIHNLSVCYRCGTAVEPLPSKQWFIDVNKEFSIVNSKLKNIKAGQKVTLKKLMSEAVASGQIEIIPERFNKTYFSWIDNLRDWCISRQIWYGHQIPVWYHGTCQEVSEKVGPGVSENPIVSIDEPAVCPYCGNQTDGGDLHQDPDTLDTWFSSGLWTFSTLGWPEKTVDLQTFHPTSVLETGYDILFFWVARMVLMTTYTLGDIPFEKVYMHGLVRDEQGRKMSKSLGNVIDPLDSIAKYGADATRLSLLLGNTPGNDTRLSEEKIAGFRNFTNKLWNMARFIIANSKIKNQNSKLQLKIQNLTLADKWILSRLDATVKDVSENIENFQFSAAGEKLRDFTWSELADWYLEIAKIEGDKEEILQYILQTLLKLWHPFMPFVTEQIWSEMFGIDRMLMVESWPHLVIPTVVEESLNDFNTIQLIITTIRSARADNKIEPNKKIDAIISAGAKEKLLTENSAIITGLARLEKLTIETKAVKPENAVALVCGDMEIYLDLSGAVDIEKETARLTKEVEAAEKFVTVMKNKLANAEFVNNAPPAVVEKETQKLAETEQKLSKLKEQLSNLK